MSGVPQWCRAPGAWLQARYCMESLCVPCSVYANTEKMRLQGEGHGDTTSVKGSKSAFFTFCLACGLAYLPAVALTANQRQQLFNDKHLQVEGEAREGSFASCCLAFFCMPCALAQNSQKANQSKQKIKQGQQEGGLTSLKDQIAREVARGMVEKDRLIQKQPTGHFVLAPS